MRTLGKGVGSAGEAVRRPPLLSWAQLPPGSIWTTAAVIARLERVALFMRHEAPERPSDRTTMQIDVVRNRWEAYGREQARLSRVLPSSQEVDAIDEALRWLFWLEPDDRTLVWARASHVKWRHLVARLGLTERGLRKRHRRAILLIVLRLNT